MSERTDGDEMPETWSCRFCGGSEWKNRADWPNRQETHEAQCPSNPDGPGHPLHGHIKRLEPSGTTGPAEALETVATEFVLHYTQNGGCSHCGGTPHTKGCFVGRTEAALDAKLAGPADAPKEETHMSHGSTVPGDDSRLSPVEASERCGGTGMVSYWDGSAYAGEFCRGCPDCEVHDESCESELTSHGHTPCQCEERHSHMLQAQDSQPAQVEQPSNHPAFVSGPADAGSHETRLNELLALPENWDGYGAQRIERDAIAGARQFLSRVNVTPCVSGGVQLEWHTNGIDLELEFDASGRVAGFWAVESPASASAPAAPREVGGAAPTSTPLDKVQQRIEARLLRLRELNPRHHESLTAILVDVRLLAASPASALVTGEGE
jgi:hypothetical protein